MQLFSGSVMKFDVAALVIVNFICLLTLIIVILFFKKLSLNLFLCSKDIINRAWVQDSWLGHSNLFLAYSRLCFKFQSVGSSCEI